MAVPKGYCVWCGAKVEPPRRRWCGAACVAEYRIANYAGAAQVALGKRDGGICAACGIDTRTQRRWRRRRIPRRSGLAYMPDGPYEEVEFIPVPWEADHTVPLWKVDRSAPDAFRYWTLANLQTLCEACHKAKTKREAAERAQIRRVSQPPPAANPRQLSLEWRGGAQPGLEWRDE